MRQVEPKTGIIGKAHLDLAGQPVAQRCGDNDAATGRAVPCSRPVRRIPAHFVGVNGPLDGPKTRAPRASCVETCVNCVGFLTYRRKAVGCGAQATSLSAFGTPRFAQYSIPSNPFWSLRPARVPNTRAGWAYVSAKPQN